MELKGREIISLPVIDSSTGEEIGKVKNLIYSVKDKRIKALILEDGGWVWGKSIIFLADIESIGKDAVLVSSSEVVASTNHNEEAKHVADYCQDLIGNKVISKNGKDCGVVEDLVFSTNDGQITGLEMSNGLLADLLEGRNIINFPKESILGDKTIILGEDINRKNSLKE